MKLLAAVALMACGGGQHADAPKWRHPGAVFVDVVQTHDATAIAAHLRAPLRYGGIWFSDPACAQQFPAQRMLPAEEIPAFAACLAKLPMVASKRVQAQAEVFVIDYAPGFEIEVQMAGQLHEEKVTWIGYASRQNSAGGLPTISGEALAALRTDHTAAPALPNANPDVPYEYAWLRVCLDATGAVTTANALETTSPDTAQAVVDHAKQWTFGPFAADGTALPVCAMTRVTGKPTSDAEVLPLEIAPREDGFASISNKAAKLVAGSKLIAPDDSDKIVLQSNNVLRIVASELACFDETGAVVKVMPLKGSGLPKYDRKIAATIQESWRYKPVLFAGKPIKACTAVTFIYTQTGGGTGLAPMSPMRR